MAKLRLLKVICQPVFVLDDGKSLIEQPAQPVEVPAIEWPTFATGRFAEAYEQLRGQVESQKPTQTEGSK